MEAELEIAFCQSNVNPVAGSHIAETQTLYRGGGRRRWKKAVHYNFNFKLSYPFIYLSTDVPMEGIIKTGQLK